MLSISGPIPSPALAQMTSPLGYSPPPLPPAPFLGRLLLESPYPLMIAFLFGSVVMFSIANRRGKAKTALRWIAAGVLTSAAAWLCAFMVVTPREQIRAATRDLVAVTAAADTAGLSPMLREDATIAVERLVNVTGRDAILEAVERYLGSQYPVEFASVLSTAAAIDGPSVGRSHAQVRVREATHRTTTITWWEIQWNLAPEGDWRVRSIEALHIPGLTR